MIKVYIYIYMKLYFPLKSHLSNKMKSICNVLILQTHSYTIKYEILHVYEVICAYISASMASSNPGYTPHELFLSACVNLMNSEFILSSFHG